MFGFYGSFFTVKGYLTMAGVFAFFGYVSATELVYTWMFNNNGISDNLVVAFLSDDPDDYQYWLVLKTGSGPSISFGTFFLIVSGFAILSLIYIYKKKLEKQF